LSNGIPGSSAGGEQPKFLFQNLSLQWSLVKFSPPNTSDLGQRISDLLICEHICHLVLEQHQVPVAKSKLIVGAKRTFLEVYRFDRLESEGRKSNVPFSVLNNEFVGDFGNWTEIAGKLLKAGLITSKDHSSICFLEMFGELIGNSDRHLGNISFFANRTYTEFSLAPVYDMLPMLYSPQANQILTRDFNPVLVIGSQVLWLQAWRMALDFWTRVSGCKNVSNSFKTIAKEAIEKLTTLELQLKRMPLN
jgi:HipA-like C-terminal domain